MTKQTKTSRKDISIMRIDNTYFFKHYGTKGVKNWLTVAELIEIRDIINKMLKGK